MLKLVLKSAVLIVRGSLYFMLKLVEYDVSYDSCWLFTY